MRKVVKNVLAVLAEHDLTPAEIAQVRAALQQQSRRAFRVGDRVSFDARTRGVICGRVEQINRKSVSIIADGGRRWRVAPSLLHAA